jgi:2-oxoglutarate dehydrogenase E2 component (dihydrolipoamide succinyltransferase)
MPTEIRVPALGESVVDATVAKWLKQEGEAIAAGEALVELETDKVNVEVPVEQAGILGKIVKQEGETVGIGEVLAIVNEEGTPAQSTAAPAQPAASNTVTPPPQLQPGNGSDVSTEQETAGPSAKVPDSAAQPSNGADEPETPVSPVARRVASENAIDIRQVTGTGPGGRVTKDDVVKVLERGPAAAAPA